MVVLRTAQWFFRTAGLFLSARGSVRPKSFPLRGRCRRRRQKRCRIGSQSVPTDARAERRSPLPSSGLRETPDATLPSRGGILRAVRSDGRKNGTSSTQSFPSKGRCRRRRRKRCRIGSQFLSTDAKTERMTPLPSSGLRGGTPYASLPARGGILRAAGSDGRKNGTSSTQSFPLRGRCRRRRRKRCRIGSQFLSTDAKTERMTPLPSSGLREAPDATLPSRGGIFARRAVPASCGPCCCPCAISSWRRRPRSRSRRGG